MGGTGRGGDARGGAGGGGVGEGTSTELERRGRRSCTCFGGEKDHVKYIPWIHLFYPSIAQMADWSGGGNNLPVLRVYCLFAAQRV